MIVIVYIQWLLRAEGPVKLQDWGAGGTHHLPGRREHARVQLWTEPPARWNTTSLSGGTNT